MVDDPLPKYTQPPVVETILGVQFDPLPRFKNAHLGAFWKTLGKEWPSVTDAHRLKPQFESFTDSAIWGKLGTQWKLTQEVACRIQIKNSAGDRMIQLQNDRLHFNWLGHGGGQYPRYKNVREGFVSALDRFQQFTAQEHLGDFRPNQWEVTYLNHIPRGTVWESPDDWTFFRPLAQVQEIRALATPESFGGEWHHLIPPQRGRLHVQWRHGRQAESGGQELVVLTFTARGAVHDHEEESLGLLEGLDLGRETIVRSFKALMSDAANRYWGLQHDDS